MALETNKESSASEPKYLLTKKDITEEQLQIGNNDRRSQSLYSDQGFSFVGEFDHKRNNTNTNKTKDSKLKNNTNSNDIKKENDNKAALNVIDSQSKDNYLPTEQIIRKKTKDEYSNAIVDYITQVESTTNNERQIIDLELHKKWQDNYDELFYECKANERNPKEKLLEEKMKEKLVAQIKKELYKSEYAKVGDTIRKEVQQEIAKDFIQKKQKEIDHIKKKIEYSTQIKLLEYEKQLMQQYKETYEKEKKEMIAEKEKEIKTAYKDRLIQMKEKAKRDLTEKYRVMNSELIKEVDDMKNQYVIQSEKEKKRLGKLNEMQFNCLQEEMKHKEKHKEINELLTACKRSDCNNSLIKQTECSRERDVPKALMRKCNSKSNIATRNTVMNITNADMSSYNNDKSVNLFEVNKRLRYSSPRSEMQITNTNGNTNMNNNMNNGKEYNHFLLKK